MLFKINLSSVLSFTRTNFGRNIVRNCQTTSAKDMQPQETENVKDPDMFISDINNPYEKKQKICILCKYKIPLDYKNPKLLSQFISPYTGYIYDKHITGLCDAQQKLLLLAIKRSRDSGFMAIALKSAQYLKDPKLFDPFAPSRPHPH